MCLHDSGTAQRRFKDRERRLETIVSRVKEHTFKIVDFPESPEPRSKTYMKQ